MEGELQGDGGIAPLPLEVRLEEEIPRLRGYLRRRMRSSRADVDDLVQESLTRALRLGGTFDTSRALWPWLRRTAQNVLADHLGSTGRAPRTEDQPVEERGAWQRDELALQEEVTVLLARLSPLERDILTRFHVHGQEIAQIAHELQRPAGTIKSHLHRARRRLAGESRHDD